MVGGYQAAEDRKAQAALKASPNDPALKAQAASARAKLNESLRKAGQGELPVVG